MRYKLLTTLIVSALHPNEPQPAGTVWEPTNVMDQQEAAALVQSLYAEETKAKVTTKTWLQRQDDAKRSDDEVTTVDDMRDAGHEDDEALSLILQGNIDQVRAELDGLNSEQLHRLDELEGDAEQGGKGRKGVHEAIADAIAALNVE